ncbi:hypothetical protein [Rubrivivax gelatinosus]|uniref:hypothetical protein n=1 Tax=Rubrivivax gelatinosus TaxID=28068 RepID=UPI001A926EBC|nr:hypothetical protein [Rubrivivax gelatinosus]
MTTEAQSTPPLLDLSSDYYEALGRIVVSFQSLEETITFALLRLTRPQLSENIVDMPYVYALSELPFKGRLKLLRNMAEQAKVAEFFVEGTKNPTERRAFYEELLRRLRQNAQECERLEDKRNQLLHSVWRPSESDPDRTARRYKFRVQVKRVSVTQDEVPLAELQRLHRDLRDAADTIDFCSGYLGSALLDKRANPA